MKYFKSLLAAALIVFSITPSASWSEVDKKGKTLTPEMAVSLFQEICVKQDPRTKAPTRRARNLGFDKNGYNAELNVEFKLRHIVGSGLCLIIFVPDGRDFIFNLELREIPGMKENRKFQRYDLYGNGQRSASFVGVLGRENRKLRAYNMSVGKNAEEYDK